MLIYSAGNRHFHLILDPDGIATRELASEAGAPHEPALGRYLTDAHHLRRDGRGLVQLGPVLWPHEKAIEDMPAGVLALMRRELAARGASGLAYTLDGLPPVVLRAPELLARLPELHRGLARLWDLERLRRDPTRVQVFEDHHVVSVLGDRLVEPGMRGRSMADAVLWWTGKALGLWWCGGDPRGAWPTALDDEPRTEVYSTGDAALAVVRDFLSDPERLARASRRATC